MLCETKEFFILVDPCLLVHKQYIYECTTFSPLTKLHVLNLIM